MATVASENNVQELYIAYFGRPADPAGLAFYADALDAGTTTIEAIATSFGTSVEAASIVALSTDDYLAAVYLQAFGRAYDTAVDGTFWADAINSGATTKELAMIQILDGAQADDIAAVTNKVAVATTYTTAVDADGKTYASDDITAAKAVLSGVTSDDATVATGDTAAQAAVDDLGAAPVESGGEGETFTLTTSQDDVVGTDGDDLILAIRDEEPSDVLLTLTIGDSIDGGAGVDTIKYTTNDDEAYFNYANITNVEHVILVDVDSDMDTVDLNDVAYETVTFVDGDGDGDVDNIAAGTDFIFQGKTDYWDLDLTDDTGSSDSMNIEFDGTTGDADIQIGNVETVNVTVSADSLIDEVDATSATALNIEANADLTAADNSDLANDAVITVTGAGDVDLATLDDNGAGNGVTLDASAMTGAMTVTSGANTVSVTTGSGDDVITAGTGDDTFALGAGDDTVTFAANLTVDDTVDGGEGVDTLAITGDLAAATITNFEALTITTDGANTAAAGDFDTYTFVSANGAHTAAVTAYTDEAVVVDSSVALASLTITQDEVTAADVANVTVNNSTNDGTDGGETTTTLTSLVATSAETINLTLSTDEANFDESNTVAVAGIATAAAALVIDGNANAALGGTVALTNTDIDASAATGDLTVTLGAADQDLTTGSGDDTIVLGANGDANDTIDGGNGTDKVTVAADSATATVSAVTTNVESVVVDMTLSQANAADVTTSYDASNLTGAVLTITQGTVTAEGTEAGADLNTYAVTGLEAAANVIISGDFTDAEDTSVVSLALETATGTADAITVQITSDDADTTADTVATQDIDGLTTTAIESVTLNVDSGIDTVTDTTITALSVSGAETLVIGGTSTTGNVEVAALSNDDDITSLDASAITEDLTLGELGTGGITLAIASNADATDTKDITLDSTDTATDTIVFGDTVGAVTIANFTANNSVVGDELDLSAFGITSSDDLVFTDIGGGDLEITTADTEDNFDTITLTGVAPGDLTDANFVYA